MFMFPQRAVSELRARAADAEAERRVAVAAYNLGVRVNRIFLEARDAGRDAPFNLRNPGGWEARLLDLLGVDGENTAAADGEASDVDVLLANSGCRRFVLRCVETDVATHLVHCLRMLRVLELKHDQSVAQRQADGHEPDGPDVPRPGPVSVHAARRVTTLLRLLCSYPCMGERLRPHLFGLLALSGANYPAGAVHIATAASDVIRAFSVKCLSAPLVQFLHDHRMIVHMTDDIKELCGMAPASLPSTPAGAPFLIGRDAEAAGLWVSALRAVVSLVSRSCRLEGAALLGDFESAGGYGVLTHAIANSSAENVPKLMELVAKMRSVLPSDPPSQNAFRAFLGSIEALPTAERRAEKLASEAESKEKIIQCILQTEYLAASGFYAKECDESGMPPKSWGDEIAAYVCNHIRDDDLVDIYFPNLVSRPINSGDTETLNSEHCETDANGAE